MTFRCIKPLCDSMPCSECNCAVPESDWQAHIAKLQQIYKDLYPEVLAACAMVRAHADNETMQPALDDVAEQHPSLTREQLKLLWFGVNAKNREGRLA